MCCRYILNWICLEWWVVSRRECGDSSISPVSPETWYCVRDLCDQTYTTIHSFTLRLSLSFPLPHTQKYILWNVFNALLWLVVAWTSDTHISGCLFILTSNDTSKTEPMRHRGTTMRGTERTNKLQKWNIFDADLSSLTSFENSNKSRMKICIFVSVSFSHLGLFSCSCCAHQNTVCVYRTDQNRNESIA